MGWNELTPPATGYSAKTPRITFSVFLSKATAQSCAYLNINKAASAAFGIGDGDALGVALGTGDDAIKLRIVAKAAGGAFRAHALKHGSTRVRLGRLTGLINKSRKAQACVCREDGGAIIVDLPPTAFDAAIATRETGEKDNTASILGDPVARPAAQQRNKFMPPAD